MLGQLLRQGRKGFRYGLLPPSVGSAGRQCGLSCRGFRFLVSHLKVIVAYSSQSAIRSGSLGDWDQY